MINNFCENCNNARKMFRKGDAVILSTDGCLALPEMIIKKGSGIISGFSRIHSNCVLVKFKHVKKPQSFHCGYWERI